MSTPPPNEPNETAPVTSGDAQPTEPYPASTGGYGPGYTAPQAPPLPPVPPLPDHAAPAEYAQPGYPQPGYPQHPYAAAPPTAPDTRSKGLAWTALILAMVGVVASLVGFVPVVWVGLIFVVLGGILLLAAFIVSLVALISKRFGGKGLSISALILSVAGGVIGSFALLASLVFIGLAGVGNAVSSDPVPSAEASEDAGSGTTDGDVATTAGEEAFLAEVRPQVTEILQQIDPTLSGDAIEAEFSDETLLLIGQALVATGEAGIDSFVDQTLAAAGDAVNADQVRALYTAIYESAQKNLQ